MIKDEPINLLLVDDRREDRVALEAIGVEPGQNFIRATSEDEALKHVLEADFAAILLDAPMPGLSGLKLAERIRARDRGRHTPILFLTDADDGEFPLEAAYALGSVDHVVRPLVPTILRAKISVFVELFRRTREARAARQLQAEAVVREQAQLWRTTLSSIGDGVVATDADGRVTFLNPVAESLTGWSAADAFGQPLTAIFRILNESSREPVENPALRALKSGTIVGLANHTILVARDGTERPIDDSAAPIRGESGTVGGAVLVFRDITERKKADAVQARLAAIVESSDDAIVGKTLDGIIQFWNAGAQRVFGYTAAEAVGRSITLIVPSDRLDEERTILERIRRGERLHHFETVRVTKAGGRVDISLTVSPIRDPDGHVIGASKVARDITDLKKTEHALAEARRRSEAALQAGEVGTYYWDIVSDRVTGDRNFAALFDVFAGRGFAPIGEFISAIHPDDRDRVAKEIGDTLTTDTPFQCEYRIVRGSNVRWVLSRGAVERGAEGQSVGWAGVLVEISRQREAEERFRLSEERRRLALDAAGLGTWNIDAATNALTADERFCVIFHGSPRPIDFEQAFAAIHPDDRERVRDGVAAAMRSEDPAPYAEDYRVIHPDGSVHWVSGKGRAHFEGGAAGRMVSLDGTVSDITARVEAELERGRLHAQVDAERRLLDAVFDALPVGLVVAEPDGRLVRMNRANEEIWGNPPPTNSIAEYRPWVGYWPETGRRIDPHEWTLARVLIGGQAVPGELVEIEPFNGGPRRHVIISGAAVRDAAGRLVAGVVAQIDVTERKRTEELLQESEERFRSLFESMDEGYCVIQLEFDERSKPVDYRYLLVNPAFEQHSGLRNAVGRSAREVMPGHEAYWFESYGHVATTGEPMRFVNNVADLGRWMEVSAFRVGAPDARQVAVLFSDVTARRRAEDALRASERRLAEVFQHAPAFMGVLRGPDHVFERVNVRYEQLVGNRELIGKTVREALPEVAGQGYIELLNRVYRTGEPFTGTDALVTFEPGGGLPSEERYVDFVYQPLRDSNGAVTGIIVQGIDQTHRKRTEALLREKEQRLQLLLGNANDYAVVITDPDGRVLDWLGGAEAITGFDAGDVIGKSAHVFFTPEDLAAGIPEREMATAARDGRAEDKRWHRKADGSQFFADGVMVSLRSDGGLLHGFGKVFRDVTARKRAEEAVRFLADASASLAELVDYESTLGRIANLAVGGFADWCVVDVVNSDGGRRRLTVKTAEPDGGAKIASFRPEDEVEGVVPHVLRTGEPEVVFDLSEADPETAAQGPTRLKRLIELGIRSYLCTPLLSRGRVIGGMTFLSASYRRRFGPEELRVAQSLAERVTIAIENAQLYRTLQEQDRRKDEFLATLAHELRNPLAPVRNGVQILRMGRSGSEPADRALAMMDRQLTHMSHLVDDLMDVSRVSSGKVVLRKERMALRAAVDAAVETTRPAVEAARHELSLRLPAESLFVEVDRTRLVQVLANLLNNAAKYTPQGGQIVLSAAKNGGDVVVQIADTGVGIPAEMLPKVFDMFTQVGTSLERSQGGLGIGLTLVKRLVEMHGGSVSAASQGPGQGSTFTVRLPLAAGAASGAAPPAVEPREETERGKFEILVVDDNRDSAESLAMLLELKGHEVRIAHDGPESLRVLGTFRPRLILLDLGLPGMSGYEVARRIRESTELRQVVLVALTGWGQEEDRRRTKEAGFDHHLVKPADPIELGRILEDVQASG